MSIYNYHTGIVLPLDIPDIDTDNIIPKQFLQETTRSNFGKYLFFDWRFIKNKNNIINPNFILNDACYQHASILLSRRNFGCGSSREHAVWALIDYGFRVIIAPSFANIFYKNSLNNHLLLITLSESNIDAIFKKIYIQRKGTSFTINLHEQIIDTNNKTYSFKIDDFYKHCLLHDLDFIGLTLQYENMIKEYEHNQPIYLQK